MYDRCGADIMARTIWSEARGDGRRGMHAVANVIMNRKKIREKASGRRIPIRQICLSPKQFSCWNMGNVNIPEILSVSEKDADFRIAKEIAENALRVGIEDITNGADHYHSTLIEVPYWAKDKKPLVVIGNHVFYKILGQVQENDGL
jgi:spore germination cell wall hydrolase CwlJ-like protein